MSDPGIDLTNNNISKKFTFVNKEITSGSAKTTLTFGFFDLRNDPTPTIKHRKYEMKVIRVRN